MPPNAAALCTKVAACNFVFQLQKFARKSAWMHSAICGLPHAGTTQRVGGGVPYDAVEASPKSRIAGIMECP